jgi:ubiquinone/menaquinone biosynthesis C-methylase UbiE
MDWIDWQQRWDAQQQAYLPDREERFTAVLDAVEAACGRAPRMLDLAGGTGSITRRVLARFPAATSVVLDIDAALLAIARGTFEGDPRVRVRSADLGTPGWLDQLGEPAGSFDAVLTATALHWLTPERVAGVYAEATRLLAPGGVLVNIETIPDPGLASLAEELQRITEQRGAGLRAAGEVPTWSQWWDELRLDPVLGSPTAERDAHFRHRDAAHTESVLPLDWHIQALYDAGHAEAGLVWRGLRDAAVLGRVA